MIRKRLGNDDNSADDNNDVKRRNTMGDNTQDDQNNNGSIDEDATANGGLDEGVGRSYSISHQKSLKSTKGGPLVKKITEDFDDDNDNQVMKFNYRAVGGEKRIIFQASLSEIYLELLG